LKKQRLIKFYIAFIMLAYIAGIIFLNVAFFLGLPKNTKINGVSVGGLNRKQAVEKVRQNIKNELINKQLQVCAGDNIYEYTYPEITWRDTLNNDIKSVKKSGDYTFKITYHLNGINEVISAICADVNKNAVEPYAIFNKSGEPFTYIEGQNGYSINAVKIEQDIINSINGSFSPVVAEGVYISYKNSLSSIKEKTVLLKKFITEYDEDNFARSSNVKRACNKINGTVLQGGKVFSFNDTVGARTQANGFLPAKIIEGGRFVDGLGGGVCQVSTTLYNAAILSGCEILEFHPHSLMVGYVAPSRDAMVSGNYFDLKFKNSSAYPLYIRASANMGKLCCEVYGKSDGAKYQFLSALLKEIAPPPPEEIEGKSEGVLVKEKSGAKSEGYLLVTKNGKTESKKIRTDSYSAVRGVVVKGKKITP